MYFKKIGALGILLTILSGIYTEARYQVFENRESIIRLQEREKTIKEHLIEIKADLKYIRRNVRGDK